MKINKTIGLACALCVLGSFGNAECSSAEDNREASAANIERLSPEIEALIAKANDGNADAQFELGYRYRFGGSVEKDPETAVKWYKKAADQGHTLAKRNLDQLTAELAQLTAKNTPAANSERLSPEIEALIAKADAGDADAQFELGRCYEEGKGVAKNPETAVQWYHKAADQGYSDAQVPLARLTAKLDRRLTEKANNGDADAQFMLGLCYEYGLGVARNPETAVQWYQKAAEQGYKSAQSELGRCYEYGVGVAKNPETAVQWYQKAADQGYSEAQYELGLCYDDGLGVAKDTEKAVQWYQKAAEQGYIPAQFMLGWCYEDGVGVAKDPKTALKWFKMAADQGHTGAQQECARLTAELAQLTAEK